MRHHFNPVSLSSATLLALLLASATALALSVEDDPSSSEVLPDAEQMEEMQTIQEFAALENAVIDGHLRHPGHLARMGPGNPIRQRAYDAMLRPGTSLQEGLIIPEGDAGDILAELGGIDLAELRARYDIPIELNEQVISYIRFFQNNGRKWFSRWLARSYRWIPILEPILVEEGLPRDTVYLAMIESGFSAYAYSWAKASGMWQFISATGKRYGLRDDYWLDERRDPILATRAAARYLKMLHRDFGHWYLAWAGYNAGEGKIRRAIRMYDTIDFWEMCEAGKYLRPETKHYVPKLIAAAIISKHPERFGFTDIEPESPFEFEEVEVADATDLMVIARAAGVDIEEVKSLNPALRRWATPPASGGKGYMVKLPVGTSERFLAEFANIAPSERLTFRHHQVRRGDTLSHISKVHGIPVAAIMRFNGLQNPRHLRIGQNLVIPLPADASLPKPSRPSPPKAPQPAVASAKTKPPASTSSPSSAQNYIIRQGDTLWSIARHFGVAVEDLMRWNSLPRGGQRSLQVGQELVVRTPTQGGAQR